MTLKMYIIYNFIYFLEKKISLLKRKKRFVFFSYFILFYLYQFVISRGNSSLLIPNGIHFFILNIFLYTPPLIIPFFLQGDLKKISSTLSIVLFLFFLGIQGTVLNLESIMLLENNPIHVWFLQLNSGIIISLMIIMLFSIIIKIIKKCQTKIKK